MEGQPGGAYGAGKAGTDFDPIAFLKKPVTVLRILSWVFAIVVFAVASDSYHKGWLVAFLKEATAEDRV